MGIQITQGSAKNYILLTFEEAWTWQEFMTIIDNVTQRKQVDQQRIQIIVDIRHSALVPKDTLAYNRYLTKKIDFQVFESIIVVGATFPVKTLHHFLLTTGNRLAQHMSFADTLEAAIAQATMNTH